MTPERQLRLCIVTPSMHEPSETFTRAHVERLPFDVSCIHGPELHLRSAELGLREDFEIRTQRLMSRAINILPRVIEFRVRARYFPRRDDVHVVADYLKRQQIDAVLAEYGTTAASMVPACQLAGIPLVAHFHGFDASRKDILADWKERYEAMFAFASAVVVVSTAMRDTLLSLGCPEQKLVLNPYGPDPSFFSVAPDYKSRTLLAVGRLTAKKAPHLTLLAFRTVLNSSPDLRLVIIGDGGMRGVCEDLIHALNLEGSVVLKGASSPTDVRREMGGAFLFVQHSVRAADGDSEGTPVAILEAGAAGLPVVATEHAGIPDIVENNRTGLLVSERDVPGMAAAMLKIANNRQMAATMGAEARQRIASHFSMERHIGSLGDTIRTAARGAH